VPCTPGCSVGGSLGRGGIRSLCLGLVKANSCLPEYFQCGHCREAARPGSELRFPLLEPFLSGWGSARNKENLAMTLLSLPVSDPQPRALGSVTPNLSPWEACLRFGATSGANKTR
jgi:hypothetical protein